MSTNSLFIRKWKVTVYTLTNEQIEISNSDSEVQSGAIRVTFDIDRPAYQACYYGDICIYNLSGPTETTLIQEGSRVVVEAGYIDGYYGKIFDGQLFQAFRERENVVDYKLTLHCLDGLGIFDNNICRFTVFAGTDQRSHISDIANNASSPFPLGVISENINIQELPRGKTFFGEPQAYLRNIALYNNAQLYIHDGQVHMTRLSDGVVLGPTEALEITPTTGLIGTPQVTQDGIQFKVLLNPLIKVVQPSMLVHLNMTSLIQQKIYQGQNITILDQSGYYQVFGLRHRGDTRGNDWYTECIAGLSSGDLALLVNSVQNSLKNPD